MASRMDGISEAGFLTVVSDSEVMERPVGPATLHTLADLQVELASVRAKLVTQHVENAALRQDREQLYNLLTLRNESTKDQYVANLEHLVRELQEKLLDKTVNDAHRSLQQVERRDSSEAGSVFSTPQRTTGMAEGRTSSRHHYPNQRHLRDDVSHTSSQRSGTPRLNVVSRQRKQNLVVSPRGNYPVDLESFDASSVQASSMWETDKFAAVRRGSALKHQRRRNSSERKQSSRNINIQSTPERGNNQGDRVELSDDASPSTIENFMDDVASAYRSEIPKHKSRATDQRTRLSSKQSIASAPPGLGNEYSVRKLASVSHSHQISQAAMNGTRPSDGRIHIPPTIKTYSAGAPMHLKPHIRVDLF